LIYLEGGTPSGLRQVKAMEEYETARLYRFSLLERDGEEDQDQDEQAEWDPLDLSQHEPSRKGKKKGCSFVQLVETSIHSLHQRDVFILDNGAQGLYQWNGKFSKCVHHPLLSRSTSRRC